MSGVLYKYGSTGSGVKQLQTYLNNAGYKLSVDGIFGKDTLAAVKNYQSKYGLSVDGIVGSQTWGKLTGGGSTVTSTGTTSTGNNGYTFKPEVFNPKSDQDLQTEAENYYIPQYNAEKEAYQNETDYEVNGLNNSKTGINSSYDASAAKLQKATVQRQQDQNNFDLSRGMGRSTYSSGMNEKIGSEGAQQQADLEKERNTQLSSIDSQINLLKKQLAGAIQRLDTDKATNIANKIAELKAAQDQTSREINEYNNTGSLQYQQYLEDKKNNDRNYQLQKTESDRNYALSKEKIKTSLSGGGSSKSSGNGYTLDELKNDTWNEFYNQFNAGNSDAWLTKNRTEIIKAVGFSVYNSIVQKNLQMKKQQDEDKW